MQKLRFLIFGMLTISCTGTNSFTEENIVHQIKLKNLNNNTVELSAYKEKTIFVNYWATWCKPCLAEMPSIEKAQSILKNDDVVFLLVSTDSKNQVKKFKASHDYTFDYLLLDTPIEKLNIQALPTTMIIAPNGELAYSAAGAKEWNTEENIALIRNIGHTP